MDTETAEGFGYINMSPLGPHFYIECVGGNKPVYIDDHATDMMNHRLHEMDQNHEWPITHEHIEGHERIVRCDWQSDENGRAELHIPDFKVSLDWYSKEQLRTYGNDGWVQA